MTPAQIVCLIFFGLSCAFLGTAVRNGEEIAAIGCLIAVVTALIGAFA